MSTMIPPPVATRHRSPLLPLALLRTVFVSGALLLAVACSSAPPIELTAEGARGRDIANANGCAACHGTNGQGTTGPGWQGLYNSVVELDDGTTVIADDDYLRRSIVDPAAEKVAGYNIKMPVKNLSDTQIDSILIYIRELR